MGDCRYYHRTAKPVCEELGVRFMVFEEGYLRPDTITLEEGGVNALTSLDLSKETLSKRFPHACKSPVPMPPTMKQRTQFAFGYYMKAWKEDKDFPAYQHHRAFNPFIEGPKWIRGFIRKGLYRNRDRRLQNRLQTSLSRKFFMVALQVHDDSQMLYHSPYDSVEEFISETIISFATHAPKDKVLVLKHHPMDRGYTHYGQHIADMAHVHGISERVIYCHDLHLPSIYNHCLGVVTVNSTVGPSALLHHIPVKTMGKAMYDLPGLTAQMSLDKFWRKRPSPQRKLFRQLQTLLFDETQINGSFFCEFEITLKNVLAFYQKHTAEKQEHPKKRHHTNKVRKKAA